MNKAKFQKSADVDPLHTFGYRFTQDQRKRERDVVVKLKKKLDHERNLRHSINREVKELKQTLSTIKGSFLGSPGPNKGDGLPPTHPNRTRH